MQNCLIGFPNRIDTSTVSGGNWRPALPLSNLQKRELSRVARSVNASAAATQVSVDLGAARATRIVSAVNHNMSIAARYRLRGSSATVQQRLANSMMAGAVAGSPGTAPTNWSFPLGGGLTRTLALGVEDGLTYLDLTISGTLTSGSGFGVYPTSNTTHPAGLGQANSFGVNLRLVSGTLPANLSVGLEDLNSAGNGIGGTGTPVWPTGAALVDQRYSVSRVTAAAGTTYVRPYLWCGLAIGQSVNVTIRIAAPMFHLGLQPYAHIPSTTVAMTGPAFEEFDSENGLGISKRFDFPANIDGWNAEYLGIKTANENSFTLQPADVNWLFNSRNLNLTSWIKSSAYILPCAGISPLDGLMTASKLIEIPDTTNHFMYQTRNGANEWTTFTVYAKAGGRSWIYLSMSNFLNASCGAHFNLATGVVASVDAPNADYTSPSAKITNVGNGWYRCEFVVRKGAVNTQNTPQINLGNGSTLNYTGDGNSGVWLWKPQLEVATTVSSPGSIPDNSAFISRASPKWEWNAAGVLTQYAAGVDVTAYDPVTHISRGPSWEPAAENLLLRSTDLFLSEWGKYQASVLVVSQTKAPDGSPAFKLIEDTTNNGHYIEQLPFISNGSPYTRSIFVKAGEVAKIRLEFYSHPNTAINASVYFDPATGGFSSPLTNGMWQGYSAQPCPDGWWRVSQSIIMSGTDTRCICRVVLSTAANSTVYLGNGSSGVYLWGGQLEYGYVATSFITTGATTVTRAADSTTQIQSKRVADTSTTRAVDTTLVNNNIVLDGAKGYMATVRLRRVAGAGWDGSVFFQTGAHGFVESYKGYMPQPTWDTDGWGTVNVDMRVTAGGGTSDFHTAAAVWGIRFDFGSTNQDVFEIAYIQFGGEPGYNSGWKDVWPEVYPYGEQEWEEDSWWSGKYSAEELDGYTATLTVALPKVVTHQYWQLEIDDTSNPDGYVEIGRLFIGPAWQPSKNASYGLARQFETDTTVTSSLSGVRRFQPQKPRRVTRMTIENVTENEMLSRAFDMDRRAGVDKEVFWVENPDDTVHAIRRQFLARFRTLGALEAPSYNIGKKTYELEELL